MLRPYVVTVHDMSRQLFAGTGWRNQLSLYRARRGLLRAAKVIAVSGATRRNAENILGIPHDHIRRIYNAPDPRFYETPSPEEMAARDRERLLTLERYQVTYPFILYAGNIRPQKNLPRLIEAFAVLRGELASHPRLQHIRLIVIGDEISKYPAVRRAAAQSRAGQSIRFLGYVPFETLRAFYESAEVFAFPSLHEGFGLPPLEAMACGTPVVTSNVSSLPEVVGDAAIKVSPDNVFEIARALRDVLLNPDLRQQLIARGFEQAHKFSWERTARQVLDTYFEVVRTQKT
jgi:glycosyltransferase involved in cell wall biosynthesis